MTKEEIIRMAYEAGLVGKPSENSTEFFEAFSALVASAERSACAKSLEQAAEAAKDADPQGFVWIAIKTSAEGIRARGQA